ncbi:MAG: MerR family transcriptional regulator [Actinobacteria bacterium]|nr:MerR family transcriptional regulator [Actinomycetota bacterium]
MARKERMTIDELAHEVGVSSRNIRYYQTRGLLPPPSVRGRTGYYGERHVERLRLIQELSSEGLNLQAIGWLLGGASGVEAEELRRLKRAVLDGWVTEPPIEVRRKDIIRGFGAEAVEDEVVQRAIALRLVEPTDDPDRWRVLLPGILTAGEELRTMGAEIPQALDVLAVMRTHAQAVADAYVQLFDEAVLAPWDARGRPEGEWHEIREAVERIRPIAGEALLAVFHQVMADAVAERIVGAGAPEELAPPEDDADEG